MRSIIAVLFLFYIAPIPAAMSQAETSTGSVPRVLEKGSTVTEVIRLRYMDPTSVAQRLRGRKAGNRSTAGNGVAMPAGIDSIVEDPRTNFLVITGTVEAIATVKKTIDALDVKPRVVWFSFSVLRFDFDAEGDWDVREVSRPKISTLDNVPAAMSVSGDEDAFSVEITPHINPDGTIVLDGGLRAAGHHTTFKRKMAQRTRAILTGITDAASASTRKAVAAGLLPIAKGEPFTVYYLQLLSVQKDAEPR